MFNPGHLMNALSQWLVLAAIAVASDATLLPASADEDAMNVVDEAIVQAGAPVLQASIIHSRDEALANGVEPIPNEIRQKLAGFISEGVLNAARFRVQGGDELSLQFNAMHYGDTLAITLDYVIVFKERDDALHDISTWVHELTHIDQYQRWGIRGFAIRYLKDADGVEREAREAERSYAAWAGGSGGRRQDTRNVASSNEPPTVTY